MSWTPQTDTTPSTLFDGFVEEYETACARGVQLSGESRDYFAAERIRLTAGWCSSRLAVSQRQIPFDRDAKPLSYVESRRLLRLGGFDVVATSFHFYFPAVLKALRRFEPLLEGLPFGAQYCVLAQRPA